MSNPSPSADDIGFVPSGHPAPAENPYSDVGFIPSGRALAQPPANVDPDLYAAYEDLHRSMGNRDVAGVNLAHGRINDLVRRSHAQDSLAGTSAFDRFNLGVGRGMEDVGLNLKEMAGHLPGTGNLQARSRAELADMQDASAPLMDTFGGKLGNFAGQFAATAPIGMGTGAALGPAARVLLKGAPYAIPAVTSALEGITQGATLAGPDNRLEGAALAGALAPAVPLGAQFMQALSRGIVQPSEAARFLMSRGVRGLTLGQVAPNSAFAQIEEAATGAPVLGDMLKKQRAQAPELWQDAVLREVQPSANPLATSNTDEALNAALAGKKPTTAPLAGRSANDKLANIYESFEPAYAPIKETQMVPQTSAGAPLRAIAGREAKPTAASILLDSSGNQIPIAPALAGITPKPSAFEGVIEDPSVLATDKQRDAVRKFLENETTLLPEMHPGQAPGPVSADSMLKMRSNIRKAAAQAEKDQQFAMSALLRNAEEKVSNSLNSQLPPEARAQLAATDAKYAQYKTVEDAIRRSGDQEQGFTPSQLSAAVRAASERGAYARGGGGPLRELAQAGKEVLDAKSPTTGALLRTVGEPPLSLLPAAFSLGTNLPGVKGALLGELPLQRGIFNFGNKLQASPLLQPLRLGAVTAGSVGAAGLVPADQ